MYCKAKKRGALNNIPLFILLTAVLLFPAGPESKQNGGSSVIEKKISKKISKKIPFFLPSFQPPLLGAQELEINPPPPKTEAPQSPVDSVEDKGLETIPATEELIRKSIVLDVETSSYYELQNWLQRLGMDTSGTKKELQERILNFYEKELGGLPAVDKEETSGEDGGDGKTARRMEVVSAGSLEYLTDEREARIIRMDGGFVLKMRDEDSGTIHTVEARSLLFDRGRKIVTAEGEVFYRMEKDGSQQVFEGDKISFNIENFRGVFVQGVSRRPRTIEGREVVFYFRGDTIYRVRRETVLFERGIISSSKMEDPYYSIEAGNLWILGLNEWALKNAVLYIGHVPIFYLPFFFRPGDTFVFHPSVGMRSLEGYYVQTTTYFLGRKTEDPESGGLFSFLQAVDDSGGEYGQELQGLFLRSTMESPPDTWVERSGSYGKIQFDYYSRLGALAGVNLLLKELENFKKIRLTAGAGLTNYIYKLPGYTDNYTPFYYDPIGKDYTVVPQEPYFLGQKIPFRFAFDLEIEYSFQSLNIDLGFPFYTDLLLRDQLTKRNEELGWTKMITGEGIEETDSFEYFEDPKFYQHTAFRPGFLEKSPLIDSFYISKLDSQLLFTYDELQEDQNAYNKLGYYYPELATPLDLELSVGGTLFESTGGGDKKAPPDIKTVESEEQDAAKIPWLSEKLRNPIESPPGTVSEELSAEEDSPVDPENNLSTEGFPPGGLKEPARIKDIPLTDREVVPPFSHSLAYTFSPDMSYHTKMDTDAMGGGNPEEVDFQPLYSYIFTEGNASLLYKAKAFGDRVSFSQSTRFQGRYRDHFDGEGIEDLKEQDRSLSYFNILGTTEMKHFFLRDTPSLEDSYFMYSIEGDFFDFSYDQDLGCFESRLPAWNEKSIKRQKGDLVFFYNRWGGTQKLQFSYFMPPELQSLDTILALQNGPVKSTLTLEADERENGGWETGPLRIEELVSFGGSGSFEQNLVLLQTEGEDNTSTTKLDITPVPELVEFKGSFLWNISRQRPENGSAALTLGWWTNRFEQRYMEEYDFSGSAWTAVGATSFQPYLFTSTIEIPYEPDPFWKNRLRFNSHLAASLQYNLIRYNESFFQFSWNTYLKIEEFLEFEFSVKSANNAMYRYVPAFSEELGKEPLNLLTDLLDSFDFSDRNARLRSNFNLQSISFSLIHYMHDWQLNMQYRGAPELDETNNYEWRSEFSVFVQWNPIPEVRKQVDYDKEGLRF